MSYSSVPMRPGVPNPYYSKVVTLMAMQPEFSSIEEEILALQAQGMTLQEILERLSEDGVEQRFMNLLDAFIVEPVLPQSLGPPPRPDALYGRLANGTHILDVGSGNCGKLRAHTGRLKTSVCEPKPPRTSDGQLDPGIEKLVLKSRHWEPFAKTMVSPLQVVTSFNAAVQLPPGMLDDFDGLHVGPDHDYLLSHAAASVLPDGKIKVRAGAAVFEDYRNDWMGYKIKPGYKLMARFAARDVFITLDKDLDPDLWDTGSYFPKLDAVPAAPGNMNWEDLGYKWDGVPVLVEFREGRVLCTDRAGRSCGGSSTFSGTASIWVEILEAPRAAVVLRILHYRGFIPPHHGGTLRFFAERVKIVCDGVKFYGPPEYGAECPTLGGCLRPIDGIISRHEERDFYVKGTWTADLTGECVRKIEARLTEKGFHLDVDNLVDELAEYAVKKKDGTVCFKFVRKRFDKLVPTSWDTVDYLLSLPTLTELTVLYKHLPLCEGFSPFSF